MISSRPSLAHRLSLALRVFRSGLPLARWGRRPESKAAPFRWPSWREGRPDWQMTSFPSYLEEGFSRNTLVYSAIMLKARAVTSSPLRAYTGSPDNPSLLPPGHWLSKLVARPNPYQSWHELQQLALCYFNIAGECYTHVDRGNGTTPQALRTLRPDRVFPIPSAGGLKGYVYIPEGRVLQDGVPLLTEDVIQVKLPNPGDPLEGYGRGMSPMRPLARSADVDNDITDFIKVFFDRGAITPIAISFDAPMDEAEMARARAKWQERYGGWEKWSDVAILDQGGKVQKFGTNFEEMGFKTLDMRNESRVLGPFGVPPIMIGTLLGLEHGTMANYETARRAFWEDTLVPELRLFEVEWQYYLSEGDAFPAYDLAHVTALRQDIDKQTASAVRLWEMGVPANVALRTVGLRVGDIPYGDTGFVSIRVAPAEDVLAGNVVPPGSALPGDVGANPPPAEDTPPPDAGSAGAATSTGEPRKLARREWIERLVAATQRAQRDASEAAALAQKAHDAAERQRAEHEKALARLSREADEAQRIALAAALHPPSQTSGPSQVIVKGAGDGPAVTITKDVERDDKGQISRVHERHAAGPRSALENLVITKSIVRNERGEITDVMERHAPAPEPAYTAPMNGATGNKGE